MDNRGALPPFLRIATRPKHTISDRNGEKIELQAPAPSTLLYVQDCKNCEFELEKKALKIIVDGCKDCLLNTNTSLLTGMIEVLNCENLAINILENGEVRLQAYCTCLHLCYRLLSCSQFTCCLCI